jgi:predicted O-methyltransferase YrrM
MKSSLLRPEVSAQLSRLHRAAGRDKWRFASLGPALLLARLLGGRSMSSERRSRLFRKIYIPVSPEVGRFLYLTARALGARSIVEFGSSFGISTLYLAAAARDNGGRVIGSELEPSKHRAATRSLADAGLSDIADVRLGDAMETLRDLPAPIDLLFLDGWKDLYLPILKMLTPRLRPGALVLADNIRRFRRELRPYVEYLQSGENAFQSVTLSLSDGLEYSRYEG